MLQERIPLTKVALGANFFDLITLMLWAKLILISDATSVM